jgi:hypothetical protein
MSKYGNRKTVVGDITFDSAKEARRWGELQLLQRAGRICHLARQVPYPIVINGVTICKFIADFAYSENGDSVCEDVKSDFTRKLPVYRLKAKLMKAVHGITVRET